MRKIKKKQKFKVYYGTYKNYLKTNIWKHQKKRAFNKYGEICLKCKKNKATRIHHLSYKEKYGSKKELKNLIPICIDCHKLLHKRHNIINGFIVEKEVYELKKLK